MKKIEIEETITNFTELVQKVSNGSSFLITRDGEPMAKLVPFESKNSFRFGTLRGKIKVSDDFDESLPDDFFDTSASI